MRKGLLCAILIFAMLFALCGCGFYKVDLTGTWECKEYFTESEAKEALSAYLFDSEFDYVDLDGLYFVSTAVFTESTLTIDYDADATIAALENFFRDLFTELYNNRTSISDYEGYFDDCASFEEFGDTYAMACFGDYFTTYEEMISGLAADMYAYDSSLRQTGDYKILGDRIEWNCGGDSYLTYTLNGSVLELEFDNGTFSYVKR